MSFIKIERDSRPTIYINTILVESIVGPQREVGPSTYQFTIRWVGGREERIYFTSTREAQECIEKIVNPKSFSQDYKPTSVVVVSHNLDIESIA
jgi:hypothetical protein